MATQSNQPTRRGRPVFAPYSPRSPPRLRSSSASSPKISVVNGPAPTQEDYALVTAMISLIDQTGTPAPTGAKPASGEEEVTIG